MSVYGLVVAVINPVEPAVGAGEPHGNAKTCHDDGTLAFGFAGCVQFNITELCVVVLLVKATGTLHGGGGAQVTLATQPAAFVVAFEVNTKVKHPEAAEEVNDGGKAVPDKVANKVAVASLPS